MNSVRAYYELLEEKLEKLEKENFELRQKLNTEEECVVMLEKALTKYKNVIQFLKDLFFIDAIEREDGNYKLGFEPKYPIEPNSRFTIVWDCSVKELKEVLENE